MFILIIVLSLVKNFVTFLIRGLERIFKKPGHFDEGILVVAGRNKNLNVIIFDFKLSRQSKALFQVEFDSPPSPPEITVTTHYIVVFLVIVKDKAFILRGNLTHR